MAAGKQTRGGRRMTSLFDDPIEPQREVRLRMSARRPTPGLNPYGKRERATPLSRLAPLSLPRAAAAQSPRQVPFPSRPAGPRRNGSTSAGTPWRSNTTTRIESGDGSSFSLKAIADGSLPRFRKCAQALGGWPDCVSVWDIPRPRYASRTRPSSRSAMQEPVAMIDPVCIT